MSCSLANARLTFPTTGVVIQPREISIEAEIGKLSYGTAKVSVRAGQVISSTLSETLPVYVSVGGRSIAHMVIEPDGLTKGSNSAHLRLRDPRIVMEQGTISGSYDDISLEEVISDVIFPLIQRPGPVITEVQYTDDEIASERTTKWDNELERYAEIILDELEDGDSLFTDAEPELQRAYDIIGDMLASPFRFLGSLKDDVGGFVFEEVSPAQALLMVEEEFEVDIWVEGAVLWVGDAQVNAKTFTVGELSRDIPLVEWGVFDTSAAVSHVVAEGPYTIMRDGSSIYADAYRGRAIASLSDTIPSSGDVIVLEPKRAESLVELEDRARRRLRTEAFKTASGSMTLNAGAVGPGVTVHPADIAIGDTALVMPLHPECAEPVTGGAYAVRGFRHEISPRNGWKTAVEVGQILPEQQIEVKSYITTPEIGSWFSAEAWYRDEQSPYE